MKRIGVTGGIGAGKSTVCRLLAARGARVFDADAEGRAALVEDDAVRRAVVQAFGPLAYAPDGSADRSWLAERVFGSDVARAVLEGIVHPAVGRRYDRARDAAEAAGCPVFIKEQAVFPAESVRAAMDAWVVVEAPLSTRLERVMARSALTRDQARARVDAQPEPEAYRAIADHVIVNDGDLATLEAQLDELWTAWGLS